MVKYVSVESGNGVCRKHALKLLRDALDNPRSGRLLDVESRRRAEIRRTSRGLQIGRVATDSACAALSYAEAVADG